MVSDESFVDLTPSGGMREVKLTPEDKEIIRENPRGLTKEGCMVKVWHWCQCNNVHLQLRYLAMYKFCKKFTKSGTLEDGSVILARRTETTKSGIQKQFVWKEKIGQRNSLGEIIIAKDLDTLQKFVEDKLSNLKFITEKGI